MSINKTMWEWRLDIRLWYPIIPDPTSLSMSGFRWLAVAATLGRLLLVHRDCPTPIQHLKGNSDKIWPAKKKRDERMKRQCGRSPSKTLMSLCLSKFSSSTAMLSLIAFNSSWAVLRANSKSFLSCSKPFFSSSKIRFSSSRNLYTSWGKTNNFN